MTRESRRAKTARISVVVGSHISSLCVIRLFMGWSWWGHGDEDIISDVNELVEELTTEMLYTWILKVVFDLELE